MNQLAGASSQEEVDLFLGAAQEDAGVLTDNMNNRVTDIQLAHGLGDASSSEAASTAASLAGSITDALGTDIQAVAELASNLADQRNADLEKDAAGAAKQTYDDSKGRATNAGAEKAKKEASQSYQQDQALAA
jgi:hypothetical protein